ncbi:hypothetical protein F183_A25770 [Bryobacterales bacterium F-183]|nr:hypothetical protein F183_A25770 [Bryobacterales bacterium F-183]
MQFGPGFKPPMGVIFDCDFGNRIDTVLALCVLYGLDQKNDCRVYAITVNKSNLRAAAAAEVVGRFYALSQQNLNGPTGRVLAIGLNDRSKDEADTPIIKALLDTQVEGKPKYIHAIASLNDTAEPAPVIRNALTAHHDQNSAVVCTGPFTNLSATLNLYQAKPWVEKKARYLVVAAGDFVNSGKPCPKLAADIASARNVLENWPTDIIFAGAELANVAPFPAANLEKDFAWTKTHPLIEAYSAAGKMPYDAPTWDVAAILQAVRPKEQYFKLSEPGVVTVSDNGVATFTAKAGGRHRHMIVDPAKKEALQADMAALASVKPVVRTRRPPPPAAAEPPKPEQKKS